MAPSSRTLSDLKGACTVERDLRTTTVVVVPPIGDMVRLIIERTDICGQKPQALVHRRVLGGEPSLHDRAGYLDKGIWSRDDPDPVEPNDLPGPGVKVKGGRGEDAKGFFLCELPCEPFLSDDLPDMAGAARLTNKVD